MRTRPAEFSFLQLDAKRRVIIGRATGRRPMNQPGTNTSREEQLTDGSTVLASTPDAPSDGTVVQTTTPANQFGPIHVPGYIVSAEIARGGMGVVYAATDPVFDREVA